jgi:DNA-binding transcriptional LysR family regulator
MELGQLRYVIAIVEHGSFSRAASELGRTQQALSKAIHGLEEELGVRLLDRSGAPIPGKCFQLVLARSGVNQVPII